MRQEFPSAVVAELTGATLRQIDYWARTGLLRPSAQEAAGKGTRRRYTFRDVVAVLTICKLRQGNCPLQKIRRAVRYLRTHYPQQTDADMLARLTLLTDGKEVYLLTDEHQILEIVSRQFVWCVPLGRLMIEAQDRVGQLPPEWTENIVVKGKHYHLLVTRDDEYGGYIVQCRELPGAMSQGRTPEEAIAQGKDAIAAVLAVMEKRRRRLGEARHVKAG